MKKCLSCGRENSDAARFCDSCGMRFSEEADVLLSRKYRLKNKQKTDKLSVVKSSIVLAVAVLITIL